MNKLTCVIITIFVTVLLVASFASATVVTFDDITISYPNGYWVQDGYAGLNWEDFAVIDPVYTGYDHSPHGAGYYNGMVSPDNVVSNANINGVIQPAYTRGADFDFIGAYFTSAWDWAPLTLTIQGYKNGNLVGEISQALSYDAPIYVAANLMNIDTVKFSSSTNQFVMDNAEYIIRNNISQVPEPSAMLLFGAGLAGLGIIRRRLKV